MIELWNFWYAIFLIVFFASMFCNLGLSCCCQYDDTEETFFEQNCCCPYFTKKIKSWFANKINGRNNKK